MSAVGLERGGLLSAPETLDLRNGILITAEVS